MNATTHRVLTIIALLATFLVPYVSDPTIGLDPLLAARIGLVLAAVPTVLRIISTGKVDG